MPRRHLGTDVLETAVERMRVLYDQGHRIVVSFSGGKDSTACLEVCIMAASMTGRLPVDVVCRDEEIMYPGTYEFIERVANRPEVNMKWIIANQPIINIYGAREMPYWWVFDPLLDPSEWVRKPPSYAEVIKEINIEYMTIPERFPPDPGKQLFACIGLRTDESRHRLYGLFTSKGYITKPNRFGVRNVRPIYDWSYSDVWKLTKEFDLDYNKAYDVMLRLGMKPSGMRIGPPTMNAHGIDSLRLAAKAWPKWFDALCERCPGVRTGVNFGKRALTPQRRHGESWEQCFKRTCIEDAPEWIAERAEKVMNMYMVRHTRHASTPFPEVTPCFSCTGNIASWKKMAEAMYNGDCFSMKATSLPQVEPEFFRPGSGTWMGGKPIF